MALTTIMFLLVIAFAIKEKLIILPLICILCGIFAMSADNKLGVTMRDTVVTISKTIDNVFSSK